MSWKFWKKKDKPKQKSVAAVVQAKNDVVSQRNEAVKELAARRDLTPIERYTLLVKTYRHGKDLMVIPEDWAETAFIKAFQGKKVFVNTPWPSIVRTH